MDLTDFLLARIGEDEAAAERAAAGPWRLEKATRGPAFDIEPDVARGSDGYGAALASDGNHIARWDPARVLTECEAKRAIVEWCGERTMVQIHHFGGGEPSRPSDFIPAARGDFMPGALAHVHDSVVLRLLAVPYAGHPDYQEEWKP